MEELNEEEMLGTEGGASGTYQGDLISVRNRTDKHLLYNVRYDVTGIWIKRCNGMCNIKLSKGGKLKYQEGYFHKDLYMEWKGPTLSFRRPSGNFRGQGVELWIEVWYKPTHNLNTSSSAVIYNGAKSKTFKLKWN